MKKGGLEGRGAGREDNEEELERTRRGGEQLSGS